jgi:23S rRNA (adenine2503-C2)-methyltransferase
LPDCKKKIEIRALNPEEISALIAVWGEKPFRGQQIFHWLQEKAVPSFDEMTNLSLDLRKKLTHAFPFVPLKMLKEAVSKDGTRKYLWETVEGLNLESVLLFHQGERTRKRNTLCVSTQIGCPLGCQFCATGKLGFRRNLTVNEIMGQVLEVTAHWRKKDKEFKINNVVYMGMGEPLLNLSAVLRSIYLLNHQDGQNIGMRRITLSTCGLVPQIDLLAEEKLDLVLAISLHAPTNQLRQQLMPINQQYPLEELMSACQRYISKTGRRITFEYLLIRGVNDSLDQAQKLVDLLRNTAANVNLIPLNPIPASDLERPTAVQIKKFASFLRKKGINVVLREEKGSDIAGACGQLAGVE